MDVLQMLKDADTDSPREPVEVDPRKALHDEILRRGPESRDEWGFYIENHISPILAEQFGAIYDIRGTLVEGHTSPVDASWEAYCTAIGRDTNFTLLSAKALRKVAKKLVFHAPRGGSKTLDLAIIGHSLCFFQAGYSITYTATQDQQIDAAWEYLKAFNAKGTVFAKKCIKAVKGKIEYTNKSNIWRVTCTPDGLNSKHPNMFIIDEVETADWDTIVEGLFSGQARMAQNRPLMYLFASTQKQPRATMFFLFRKCETGKARLMRWNWKSVVEKCLPDRRDELPTGLTCEMYKGLAERVAELESDGQRSVQAEQELLQSTHKMDILADNCLLVSRCQGCAKKGRGYMSIDQLNEQLEADPDAFDAQFGCDQPNMKNAVYNKISAENISLDIQYNPGAEQAGFLDYGYATDPTAIGICNLKGSGFEQWFEEENHNMDDETLVLKIKDLTYRFSVEQWAVSPEAKQLKTKLINAGIKIFTVKSPVEIGCGNLAHFIKSGRGTVLFQLNPRMCPRTWEQLQTYFRNAKTGQPTKVRQNNHHWDFPEGLRYFANMLRQGVAPPPKTLKTTWRKFN